MRCGGDSAAAHVRRRGFYVCALCADGSGGNEYRMRQQTCGDAHFAQSKTLSVANRDHSGNVGCGGGSEYGNKRTQAGGLYGSGGGFWVLFAFVVADYTDKGTAPGGGTGGADWDNCPYGQYYEGDNNVAVCSGNR